VPQFLSKLFQLDRVFGSDRGYNLFRAYGGTLPEEFPYYRIIHLSLDKTSNTAMLPSGLRVPMRPFFGQLGVAPPKDFGRQNSKEPREFGGNIDCKELTTGQHYLPAGMERGRAVLDRRRPRRPGRR
jgi:acetamidase/formamidase